MRRFFLTAILGLLLASGSFAQASVSNTDEQVVQSAVNPHSQDSPTVSASAQHTSTEINAKIEVGLNIDSMSRIPRVSYVDDNFNRQSAAANDQECDQNRLTNPITGREHTFYL